MTLNFDAFVSTLPIMAKGLAGIFIVTGVLIVAMLLLRKLGADKQDKE